MLHSDGQFPAVRAMALFLVMTGVRLGVSAGSTPVVPKLPQGQVIISPSTNAGVVVYASNTKNVFGNKNYGLTDFPLESATALKFAWKFEPLIPGQPYCPPGRDCVIMRNIPGMYAFQPINLPPGQKGKWCLDIALSSAADGTPVIAYPCHYRANQQFNVLAGCGSSAGVLLLKAQNSAKCLKFNAATGLVVQWTCDQQDRTQLWQFYGNTTFSGGLDGCPSPPPASPPPHRSPSPNLSPYAKIPVSPSPSPVQVYPPVNWALASRVSPVRDQGQTCASAWAIVAVAATEAALAIKYKTAPQQLSTQILLSCVNDSMSQGCYGGDASDALRSLSEYSIPTDRAYPYTSGTTGVSGVCKTSMTQLPSSDGTWFKGAADYTTVGNVFTGAPATEASMMAALKKQPLIVYWYASNLFAYYTGGIFTVEQQDDIVDGCHDTANRTNHVMLLVGYDPRKSVWIFQNSYGTSWGEKGYIRVAVNGRANGPCGMYTYVLAPSMNFQRVPYFYTGAPKPAPKSSPSPKPSPK